MARSVLTPAEAAESAEEHYSHRTPRLGAKQVRLLPVPVPIRRPDGRAIVLASQRAELRRHRREGTAHGAIDAEDREPGLLNHYGEPVDGIDPYAN